MKEKHKKRWLKTALIGLCAVAIMFGLSTGSVWANEADPHPHAEDSEIGDTKYRHPKHGSLGQIGAKLSNPVSDIWAIVTSWNMPAFYDGDVNTGDPEVGASMVLQPLLPIPIFGTGKSEWRMVTRPIIPLVFSEPVPTGFDEFDHKGGIGDIQLPLLVNLPESIAGNWLIGAGGVSLLPSATTTALGKNQWAMGPAVVVGYKTKKATFGIFPNYFWKIGSAGQGANTPNINQGSLLYFFNYALPNAWEVGFNPTITYNHQASSGNKWNVPVGFYVGKTITLGKLPVNIKVGGEYSVVSPDTYGLCYQFRIQITPVIPGLVQNPIFGK